jgi:hypothetical protein
MDLICLPCLPSRRTGPRSIARTVCERLARCRAGAPSSLYIDCLHAVYRAALRPRRVLILNTLTTPNSNTTHIGIPTTHIRLCHSPGPIDDRSPSSELLRGTIRIFM